MLYQTPRGTQDYLPGYLQKWRYVEGVWQSLSRLHGFREIATPMFEHTELFARTAGESSDIVAKEMYTFTDRGGRSLTLRPEGTAAVVRAYLQNGMASLPKPVKLAYLMPMFRYERPQAGRFRQHHQYGVEVIGSASPLADASVILLVERFYQRLGLRQPLVHLNSIGDENCRPAYRERLVSFLSTVKADLCADCQYRLEQNPLRVLDCKNPACQALLAGAPLMIDNLCEACREHHRQLERWLSRAGVETLREPKLVRGLDYYTRTVFEFTAQGFSRDEALAGGGRYDKLIGSLGGQATPAVGFGAGLERLIWAMERHGASFPEAPRLDVYLVPLETEAEDFAFDLLRSLRDAGVSAELDLTSGSLKSRLSRADKLQARFAVIVGGKELAERSAVLRNLATHEQSAVPFAEAPAWIAQAVARPEGGLDARPPADRT